MKITLILVLSVVSVVCTLVTVGGSQTWVCEESALRGSRVKNCYVGTGEGDLTPDGAIYYNFEARQEDSTTKVLPPNKGMPEQSSLEPSKVSKSHKSQDTIMRLSKNMSLHYEIGQKPPEKTLWERFLEWMGF